MLLCRNRGNPARAAYTQAKKTTPVREKGKPMRLMICAIAALLSTSAWSDSHESDTYIYGTYMYCDASMEDAADATFEKYYRPILEDSLRAGEITGWGYLKHMVGGKWRRLVYRIGPGAVDVINAVGKHGEAIDKKLRSRDDNLLKACKAHDDYIWKSEFGTVGQERGKVGISVYFVCDMNREGQADELVEKDFKPVYDAQLGPGKLTSWGWLSHRVGGKYRRALTITAANLEELFQSRAELLEKFSGSATGREFTSICHAHTDYVWDTSIEGR